MPFLWRRSKSCRNKPQHQDRQQVYDNCNRASTKYDKKKDDREKPKSSDEVSLKLTPRNSPRSSLDFPCFGSELSGSSAFAGFYSDREKRGHPLPRPSISSALSVGVDHGVVLGSGSFSVSSVSSFESSDEIPPDQGLSPVYRVHGEAKVDPRSRSLERGSRAFTTPTSPTHPRLCGMFMESPTGKNEGERSPSHPLPLPPVSPTRTTNLQTQKNTGSNENSQCYYPKWRKGKLLGRGTFGQVYVGFNSESGQMCAIKEVKVIADDKTSNECLKQLNQEIKMLSQLSHPNIVQYYGSELGEDALSVYLEYVSGGSIQKLLREYGPFKEPVIQNYARQILFGLAYLHGKNTLHRDIKGANILVDPNGEIKLADFGMAKHITSHTSMLSFKGSPYWMAPEVIMNISGYNLAVDIWSLGCTVIEMATTKPPWSQYEGVAAIFKIGNSKDMPDIPDHLSSEAKNFINLCLQRDPSARPTAVQLLDHPFIRNQAVRKVAKNNVINDGFPSSIDGGYRQIASELHSNKARMILPVEDCSNKPKVACSRASGCSRDGMRLITSLPMSPCSSPVQEHRSCLYSPPHLAYSSGRHSNYAMKDYSVLSTRPNKSYPADLWGDMPG